MADDFIPFDVFKLMRPWNHSSRIIHNWMKPMPAYRGSVSPIALYFGSLPVGTQSVTQTATLTNTGFKPLPIKAITGTGDFVITTDCPLEGELAVGASCSITATFVPMREGATSGGIYVDTGDAQGTEFVLLQGSGTPEETTDGPASSMTPNPVAFGSVEVDTDSAAKTLTITNTGTASLTITAITLSSSLFTKVHAALPITVAAGTSVAVTLTFHPLALGAVSGSLTIATNGTGTKTVSLTGTGAAVGLPVISISNAVITALSNGALVSASASSHSFGSVDVDTDSDPFLITLTNDGTEVANILSITANGNFAVVAGSAAVGDTIAADGGTAEISVVFHPLTEAALTGSLVITTDATVDGDTITVSLSGTGGAVVVPTTPRLKIVGNQLVTVEDNTPVRLKSVNWFGAESTNYTPHGTWAVRWTDILDDIAAMGFNCIRMPFSGDFCTAGRTPPTTAIDFDKNAEFSGKSALEVMDLILDYCETLGLYVVFDHHRRTAGQGADGSPVDGSYTQAQWLADWNVLATRYADHPVVVGADVHNEPHDLTWDAWATYAEACGNSILATAPDWLIFVEGVGQNNDSTSYWWGGALKDVATRPVTLNVASKVVYSPHEYGQSVGSQAWLSVSGNEVANYPNNLYAVWQANWGFIFENNIAPIWIGEFGGFFGVDGNGAATKPNATYESQWVTNLIKYLNGDYDGDGDSDLPTGKVGMSAAYWSYNPNSGDTGGLVQDDWATHQTVKLNLLAPFLS